jgi:deoxyribodipyrimidine photo-lyase
MRRALVLFTRDLRVHDHAALSSAVDAADEVVPLFVFDETLGRAHRSAAREAFLLESVADLRDALRRSGGDLFLRRGDPAEETLRVARAADAGTVFLGVDGSGYAQRRQKRLALACGRERVELRVENTLAAVAPGEITPGDRDHYRIFTPYWRRWRGTPLPEPLDPPGRIRVPVDLSRGDLPSPSRPVGGGERAARRRLDLWLGGGLHDYDAARNDLAGDGTSRLSAFLHFGCISPLEVVTRARREGPVTEEFVRQLCWRDFYLQLLAANPRTAAADLHPRGRAPSDDEEAFEAWANGRTGYPIVDAAMRQLRSEGWIHNRARLIVAAFLTKTLEIDWQSGARIFFDLLVDGDIANNAGNWQWVAGTGVDTRPNRGFNPIAQAKRFDPQGKYVRTHLPELGDLKGSAIHEPWRAPLAARVPEYPERIVDLEHRAARA